MGDEGGLAGGRQAGPGALAAIDRGLGQFYVADVLQLFQVFGQDRVRDLEAVADQGELGLVEAGQDGADLQPPRGMDDRVEDEGRGHCGPV